MSLGCENNNIHEFLPVLGDYDRDRFRVLVTQEAGDELGTGLELLRELAEIVKRDKRVRVPASELKIAFKCRWFGFPVRRDRQSALRHCGRPDYLSGRLGRADGGAGNVRSRDDPHEPGRLPGDL